MAIIPYHGWPIHRTTTCMETSTAWKRGFVPIADFYPADGFSLARVLCPAGAFTVDDITAGYVDMGFCRAHSIRHNHAENTTKTCTRLGHHDQ